MMFWQQEPLATLFWGCLIVFVVTWAWAGDRYHRRGRQAEREEWKAALNWADEVLALPRPDHRTMEQWASMQRQAADIRRGLNNEHWSTAQER